MFKNIISTFIVIFICTSCVNNSNTSRKPVSQIEILSKSNNFILGDQITINVNSKTKNGKIKNIKVYIDNNELVDTTSLSFQFVIKTNELEVGNHTISVKSIKDDETFGINYSSFILKSDIVPEKLTYKILNTYNHNNQYFTEGFEFRNNTIFEGTGENGKSSIYNYNHKTGKIISQKKIESQYFGEGITILNNKLYQLTYKHQIGFVYDATTLEKINEFNFKSKEGWGMTNNKKMLIMSDGTSSLTYINPENFNITRVLNVCDNNGPVINLNELEWVNGVIYANIWQKNTIAKIDEETGKVLGYLNLDGITNSFNTNYDYIDVLNGIAWNSETNKFLITGKYWPKMFEIEIKSLK